MSGVLGSTSSFLENLATKSRHFIKPVTAFVGTALSRALTIPVELIGTAVHYITPGVFDTKKGRITIDDQNLKRKAIAGKVHGLVHQVLKTQTVRVQLSSKEEVDSAGGTFFSFKKPVVYIPESFLLDEGEDGIHFDDLEKDFLLAKELIRIRSNVGLYRIFMLATLFALVFIIPPFGLTASFSVLSWSLYLGVFVPSQYAIERSIDRQAIEIVSKKILSEMPRVDDFDEGYRKHLAKKLAYKIASSSYEKIRQLNLKRKKEKGNLLILSEIFGNLAGSNWWYLFIKPSLGHRVDTLYKKAEAMANGGWVPASIETYIHQARFVEQNPKTNCKSWSNSSEKKVPESSTLDPFVR